MFLLIQSVIACVIILLREGKRYIRVMGFFQQECFELVDLFRSHFAQAIFNVINSNINKCSSFWRKRRDLFISITKSDMPTILYSYLRPSAANTDHKLQQQQQNANNDYQLGMYQIQIRNRRLVVESSGFDELKVHKNSRFIKTR